MELPLRMILPKAPVSLKRSSRYCWLVSWLLDMQNTSQTFSTQAFRWQLEGSVTNHP